MDNHSASFSAVLSDRKALLEGIEENRSTREYCQSGGYDPKKEHCEKCPDICVWATDTWPELDTTLKERIKKN